MSTSFALLELLHRVPGYGHDLKRDYDQLFGQGKPLAYGQIYATLSRPTLDNLIAMEGVEIESGPKRNRYAITQAGRASLDKSLRSREEHCRLGSGERLVVAM